MPRRTLRPSRLLPVLALLASACGVGVPQDRQLYVGQWDGENVNLRIEADGRVAYERSADVGDVKIRGPIQRWEGEDFAVGLPFLATTFDVQQPPWLEGGRWRMVVDGHTLVRSGDPFAARSAEVRKPELEIVDVGVFGRQRSDGSRPIVTSTSRVPAAVGRSFGATLRDASSRVLTFRWEHPAIRDPRSGAVHDFMRVHATTVPGKLYSAYAEFEHPNDLVAGEWTLHVLDGDRLLTTRTFDVYVP